MNDNNALFDDDNQLLTGKRSPMTLPTIRIRVADD